VACSLVARLDVFLSIIRSHSLGESYLVLDPVGDLWVIPPVKDIPHLES